MMMLVRPVIPKFQDCRSAAEHKKDSQYNIGPAYVLYSNWCHFSATVQRTLPVYFRFDMPNTDVAGINGPKFAVETAERRPLVQLLSSATTWVFCWILLACLVRTYDQGRELTPPYSGPAR